MSQFSQICELNSTPFELARLVRPGRATYAVYPYYLLEMGGDP